MNQIFFDRHDPEDPDGTRGADDPALFRGPSPHELDPDEPARILYVEDAHPRRIGRWLAVLGGLVLIAVVAVGGAAFWVQRQVQPPGGPGEELAFTIPEGATAGAIAERLEAEGVIANAQVFELYLRATGAPAFQAGDYQLREQMSMGNVVGVLEDGPETVVTGRITIPEGLWLSEIVERVGEIESFSADAFRQAIDGGAVRSMFQPADKPLEGLLFPDTYNLDGSDDETELLERMVKTFDATAAELGYEQAPERVGRSPYETVIVASLIEAEAKSDVDRPKIARVIYNRLDQGIALGIDATVYYALDRRGGGLTRSDLEIDSPYNTRDVNRAGLVPTPIGAPGAASLAAAINPEPGPWLYYVLKDPETHAFSEDYEEFLRDRDRARQEGLIP